jgi:hypothetical protein
VNLTPEFEHVVLIGLGVLSVTAFVWWGHTCQAIWYRQVVKQKLPTREQLDRQYWTFVVGLVSLMVLLAFSYLNNYL